MTDGLSAAVEWLQEHRLRWANYQGFLDRSSQRFRRDSMSNVVVDGITEGYLRGLDDQHEWATLVRALDASSTEDCVDCGRKLGGLLIGTFEWGIVNGEGTCGHCGFPYRLYHRFKTEDYKRPEIVLCAFVPLADPVELPTVVGGTT